MTLYRQIKNTPHEYIAEIPAWIKIDEQISSFIFDKRNILSEMNRDQKRLEILFKQNAVSFLRQMQLLNEGTAIEVFKFKETCILVNIS